MMMMTTENLLKSLKQTMTNKYSSLAAYAFILISLQTLAGENNGSNGANQQIATPSIEKSSPQHIPDAPEGFVWRGMRNVIFLRPENWKEQSLSQNIGPVPTVLYASSAENFGTEKPFETGFTLRIAYDIRKTVKMDASKFGQAMLSPIFQHHTKEDFKLFNQEKKGDFDLMYLRYRDAPQGMTPIIIHKFVMSNDATDTSYEATFESPENSWDANWAKFGSPIFGKILFTSEGKN